MAQPILTLDSKYPGLMAVTLPQQARVVFMTREEARDFGIAVLAMSEQGFMRATPEVVGDFPELRDAVAEREPYIHRASCSYKVSGTCTCGANLPMPGEDDGVMGSCGCIDYHYADCPTRDRSGGYSDPSEPDDDYNPDHEDREDDDDDAD